MGITSAGGYPQLRIGKCSATEPFSAARSGGGFPQEGTRAGVRVPFYLRATRKNLRRSTQAWGSGEFHFWPGSGEVVDDPHNLIR